ncbi:MAG: hypothetical protein AMJ66_10445 [Betaproteobacteria bacterium SG8_40]|nr:MAG: hypothetical protein AMJ66_10445 [Betaproteobacteria bacterium SG8_40]
MKKPATLFFGLIASGLASSVMAHGGHGVTAPASLTHYLIEPLHLLPAFAPLAVIAVTIWLLRRKAG